MQPFYADYFERLSALHDDLAHTIDNLPQEALDWVPGADMNSLSVLVAHVAGSEMFWIGDVVARGATSRDREAEFRTRDMNAAALQARLAAALADSRAVLETLTEADLATERTSPRDGHTFHVAWSLLHALEHFGLHAGHAQMIRQMWDQRAASA